MALPGGDMSITVGDATLCVVRASATETLTTTDVTTTCSPKDARNVVYEQVIGSSRRVNVNIEGQFEGVGDPPYIDVGETLSCTIAIGFVIVGDMLVTQWDFNGEIKGVLAYTLQMMSNGEYTIS